MDFPITPEQFAAIQQKAGVDAAETRGTVTQQGVVAGWSYSQGVLTATILKKPRLIPESYIWKRFRAWAGLSP